MKHNLLHELRLAELHSLLAKKLWHKSIDEYASIEEMNSYANQYTEWQDKELMLLRKVMYDAEQYAKSIKNTLVK